MIGRWLEHRRLWQKFALLGVLGMFLVGPPLYLYLDGANRIIDASRHELASMAPSRNALLLLQYLQQHRGISAAFLGSGDPALDVQRVGKDAQVAQTLLNLQTQLRRQQPDSLAQAMVIGERWRSLQSAVAHRQLSVAQSYAQHTDLCQSTVAFIEELADDSGLSLDPDADTYYLMRSSFIEIPALTEAVGETRARGAGILASGRFDATDRADMTMLVDHAAMLESSIGNTLDKALAANKNLHMPLHEAMTNARRGIDGVLTIASHDLVRANTPQGAAEPYLSAFTQAIDGDFRLGNATLRELERLLSDRLARQIAARNLLAGGVVLIAAFAAMLGWLITHSILQAIQRTLQVVQAIADGHLDCEIADTEANEFGLMLVAVRSMQHRLRSTLSELRANADALFRQSEQLRRVLELSPVAVAVVGLENDLIHFINAPFASLFALDRNHLGSLRLPALLPLSEAQRVHIAAAIGDSGGLRNDIITLERQPGQRQWFMLSTFAIDYDHQSATLLWLYDISSLKQVEAALEHEKRTAQNYLDIAGVMMVVLDTECKVALINKKGCNILGYSEDQVLGRDWVEQFMPTELRLVSKARFAEFMVGSACPLERNESAVLNRQGHKRLISWFTTVLHDDNGHIIGTISSGEDITERRQAEMALSDSLTKFRQYFEQPLTGMATLTADLYWLEVNQKLADMLGYPLGQLLQLRWVDLVHPDDRANAQTQIDRLLQGNHASEEVDRRMQCRDGRMLWTSQVLRAVYRDDGSVRYLVALINDISDRKRIEDELRAASVEALAASRAKSDFLANMSHEIRTPMNGIIGLTHLALRTNLNAQQRDYLTKIQHSSQSLLGIVNDILDFSKIEAGKLEIETIDFSLDQTFANVVSLVGQRAAEKKIELVLRRPPTVPNMLIGDPLRLGQVLVNLVSNAVKFTEQGHVVIGVELGSDGSFLQFYVEDTGIGIATEQLQRMFQAFRQGDSSTTRRYGGSGLGLVICKRLVEMMGGRISATSILGQGSTFSFTMPLEKSLLPSSIRAGHDELLSQMRALVADDNNVALLSIVETLRAFGLQTTGVADGFAALDEVRHAIRAGQPYALVFVDWQMPGMDGFQLIRRLRQEYPGSRMVFIMVTGHDRAEVFSELDEVRPEGFLLKPITPSLLFDVVMQATRAGGLSGTIPEQSELRLRRGLQGLNILLVEDNAINQQIASELLRSGGARVTAAGNGVEALALLEQQIFDLVLMDIQMPEMDGFQATQAIRSDPRFASLPIVAMTAHAMSGDRDKCLAVGMNDHISKPFNPEELFRMVEHWARSSGVPSVVAPSLAPVIATGLPASLPGIDLAAALARVANNQQLLLHLLRLFAEEKRDALAQIELGMRGDRQLIRPLVHRLKGSVGNLGMQAAFQACLTLERTLPGGSEASDPDNVFQELRSALDEVFSGLLAAGIVDAE